MTLAPKGLPGADGADGAQGPQGDQGPQGIQGPAGADGADGSDANVTKANVEAVLTGEISSHTHAGGGGGGTTIEFFHVMDSKGAGQLTTGSMADLTGIWDTPVFEDSAAFSWNGTTGVLTINKTCTLEITVHVSGYNNANNRNQLNVQIVERMGHR